MSRHRIFAFAAFSLFATACASSLPGTDTVNAPTGSRNFLPQEEIGGRVSGTALDAVRMLRPAWLVKRGPQSVSYEADIWVYLGRARMGGIEALREISAGTVAWLEFLSPAAANYRFGAGHPHGAIVVSMTDPAARR
ncbi:MAG: hypothetical protein WDZ58_05690 [Gemmatimonadaceae bacterium]